MTPDLYARDLLAELGEDTSRLSAVDSRPESELWAESGAQYLTGEPDGPALDVATDCLAQLPCPSVALYAGELGSWWSPDAGATAS